eukprot:jgi/Hompol1/5707/HPOL_004641-RA
MAKPKKSTKRFLKSRLKDELVRRKKHRDATKHIKRRANKTGPATASNDVENENADTGSVGSVEDDDADKDFGFGSSADVDGDDLETIDPFENYLQENDQSLLNFGGEGDIDDENNEETDGEAQEDDGTIDVTLAMLKSWRAQVVKKNSLHAIRKILMALRAVEADEDDQKPNRYRVEDGKVSNSVVVLALKYSPIVFNNIIYGSQEPEKRRKGLPTNSKKWKKISRFVKSFLNSMMSLFDRFTDSGMLSFMLKQADACATFIACYPKISKSFIRAMLNFWSTSDSEQVRILAFLAVRRLAIAAPSSLLQPVIKNAYTTFAVAARNSNVHTWTQINFMANSIIEFCGIHMPTTYQLMFVYVRQMAIQLRSAISNKTKESYQLVYTWPFLQSVRLWARLLAKYCDTTLGKTK